VFTYVYIYKTYYLDKYKPGSSEESKEVKIKKEEICISSNIYDTIIERTKGNKMKMKEE